MYKVNVQCIIILIDIRGYTWLVCKPLHFWTLFPLVTSFHCLCCRYKSYYDEGGSAEVSSEIPPVTPQAGKQNGLRVLVDLKATDLTPASVTEDFNGIQALVANRDNFPVMISQSFLISPGRETQVVLL